MGIVFVAAFTALAQAVVEVTMTSTFKATNSAASEGNRCKSSAAKSVFDDQIVSLDIAELAQCLNKQFITRRRPDMEGEVTNAINLACSLCPCSQRVGQNAECNADPEPSAAYHWIALLTNRGSAS
jgi:hypothetical protein